MKPRLEAAPIDPPYYTDEELAPWWRCFRGAAIQHRNVFAHTYRNSERRDADLMYEREFEKARAQPWERWENDRRRWFPARWGLS